MDHLIDRILPRCTESTDGCWVFTGAGPGGYGQIEESLPGGRRARRTRLCHVVTYLYFIGEVPASLDLDHLCRVRKCCNPWHLEPVTRSVNALRSPLLGRFQRSKTHCPQGHAYDEVNTYVHGGKRSCRTCMSERGAARRASRRLESEVAA